jgi:hypothetical protein
MIKVLQITLLVSFVLLLNAITTLLFIQNAIPASAGGDCVSGDINGDATVDITDPVHLLSYIFEGGPEPVACAQTPTEVIVANTVDMNLVNVPTVELQGIPTVRIVGGLDPQNAISIPFTLSSGAPATEIYEVPAGFRLFITDFGVGSSFYADYVIIYRNDIGDRVYTTGLGGTAANQAGGPNWASFRAPLVFQEGEIVLVDRGQGYGSGNLLGFLMPTS